MAFYQYRQNNSGGTFDVDEQSGISVVVIIEAVNAEGADQVAEYVGLYFDGSFTGHDCSCCGDRWARAYSGDKVPSYYGVALDLSEGAVNAETYVSKYVEENAPIGFVHYLDGRVVGFY